MYAIGGNDGTASLDKCECYDPFKNKWTNVACMGNKRAGAGVGVLDGYIYAVGMSGIRHNLYTLYNSCFNPVFPHKKTPYDRFFITKFYVTASSFFMLGVQVPFPEIPCFQLLWEHCFIGIVSSFFYQTVETVR